MVSLCFKEKSTIIKCIFFLISVLIMLLVALAIILTHQPEEFDVCKNEQCIKLSAQIIRHVDKAADPCNDFYAYSCSNFVRNKNEVSTPEAEEELQFMIREIPNLNDSKPFLMQKSFYAACANLGAIEMDDDETLLNLFFSVGDWPVLRGSSWSGTLFDWTQVAIKNRRLGLKFDWFLDFSIYADVNGTGLNYLKIDVPKVRQLKEWEILPRQKLFTQVAINLGAPERLAHYETGRTIDFENALGSLVAEHRGRQGVVPVSYPKTSIDEVQKLWPNIRWLELINNITGMRLSGRDHIIFHEVIDYVSDLNQLIYGTPKRIVADYMMWKIVEEWHPYLTHPVREKFEKHYEEFYKLQPELDRPKFCVNESRKQFPLIADSEYIRRHVTQEKRTSIKEMLFTIRNKFVHLVRRATNLSKDVRQQILYKLERLQFLVGGPNQIFDEFGWAEDLGLYSFFFKSSNIVDMLTERQLRHYDYYYEVVGKVVRNTTAPFYAKVVNVTGFSILNENTLVIPAAVLRDAFYNPKLPSYFNYATLGTTLAHAIFEHVFNTSDFGSAIKCLMKETSYNQKQILADFVGPEVAYEAYKDWALLHSRESKLPAVDFTPNQLFWLHTSKLSCKKIYSKHDRDRSRFKIMGPLRNLPQFADDFNCTLYSKMVSVKPCRIF